MHANAFSIVFFFVHLSPIFEKWMLFFEEVKEAQTLLLHQF